MYRVSHFRITNKRVSGIGIKFAGFEQFALDICPKAPISSENA